MREGKGHEPDEGAVATALVKVLTIALVIGVVIAGGIFLVVRGLGLGEGGSSAASDLPDGGSTSSPLPTVALTPSGRASSSPSASASGSPSESPSPDRKLTLSAGQAQVAPGQRIDLDGQYAGQDGTVLQVQRRTGGSWEAFSDVTARVQGGSFTTYVMTSRGGEQRFRVYDQGAEVSSNPVTVTVG